MPNAMKRIKWDVEQKIIIKVLIVLSIFLDAKEIPRL